MKYSRLVTEVADRLSCTRKEVGDMVDTMVAVMSAELGAGRDVQIKGIGTFRNSPRKEQNLRLRTGNMVVVPPGRRIQYRPSRPLREVVKSSYHLFKTKQDIVKGFLPENMEDE